MKRSFKIVFLVFFVLLTMLPENSHAELQLWIETGLRYRLNKKFRIEFDQGFRFDDNASHLESILPEISLRYRPVKFVHFKSGYRFIAEWEGNDYTAWHRIFFDTMLRHSFKPANLAYRLRFQEQFGWPYSYAGVKFKNTVRNRFTVRIDAGRGFEPYVEGELYLRINDNDGLLHKWRTTLGIEYNFEDHQFALFYREESMLNGSGDPTTHILGLGYNFTF